MTFYLHSAKQIGGEFFEKSKHGFAGGTRLVSVNIPQNRLHALKSIIIKVRSIT